MGRSWGAGPVRAGVGLAVTGDRWVAAIFAWREAGPIRQPSSGRMPGPLLEGASSRARGVGWVQWWVNRGAAAWLVCETRLAGTKARPDLTRVKSDKALGVDDRTGFNQPALAMFDESIWQVRASL